MNTTYILIVGAKPDLVPRVRESLESPNVHLAFAFSLREAYRDTSGYRPDFVVLDLESELLEGFELVEVLRGRQSASLKPVLVFRPRAIDTQEPPKTLAIELSVLRNKLQEIFEISGRLRPVSSELDTYSDERFDIDFENAVFIVDERRVTLSVREQELLRFLIERADRIVLREELFDGLWGYETRALDVFVRRLRVKLGDAANRIEGVHGFGYRFLRSPIKKKPPARAAARKKTADS